MSDTTQVYVFIRNLIQSKSVFELIRVVLDFVGEQNGQCYIQLVNSKWLRFSESEQKAISLNNKLVSLEGSYEHSIWFKNKHLFSFYYSKLAIPEVEIAKLKAIVENELERLLMKSQDIYLSILNKTAYPVIILDLDCQLDFVSDSVESVLRISRDKLQQNGIVSYFDAASKLKWDHLLKMTRGLVQVQFSDIQPIITEINLLVEDNLLIETEMCFQVIQDHDLPENTRFFLQFTSIQGRKEMDNAIQEKEAELNKLYGKISEASKLASWGYWEYFPSKELIILSDEMAILLEGKQRLLKLSDLELLLGEEYFAFKMILDAAESGKQNTFKHNGFTSFSQHKVFKSVSKRNLTQDKETVILVVSQDITCEEQLRTQLKSQDVMIQNDKLRFDGIIHHAPNPIILLNESNRIVYGNVAAIAFLGYPHQKLNELTLTDLFASQGSNREQTLRFPSHGQLNFKEQTNVLHSSGLTKRVEMKVRSFNVHDERFMILNFSNLSDSTPSDDELRLNTQTLMSMPIGILILHNKTIEFINPMLVAILGLGNEDNLLGKELTDVLPETSWIAFNEKLEEFGYNMTSDRFQSGFENALGNYIFLQMRFISTTFNGKHSVMVTTNDVSNQRYTEQVLLHEKQKAQESDRLKFNFIANLSHEVRTPVNAIMGFGQLVEQELDMPRDLVNEYLQIIVQSSRELVQTIDNLVEVSEAFTNSADSTEYTPFSVSDLFMQLETQYKHKNSKLEFKIEYPPRQTGTLLSDFDKLKKIISTLIDNSFKFTTKGFVRVYYCEDDNLQVISVEDSGIGIHEEQQKRIFELFQQGELNSDNRQYGGTGTGLFLANLLARILGIRIELKSEIGKGSVFSLIMRKSEYFGYHSNESSSDSDTLLANKMVLIVEDSLANTLLLEELVANLGGSSHAVYTGRDAIEYIAKDKPCDLILLDIQMPDIDGYAVFNKVRTLRHMPIIAQTAYALNSDKDKAAKLGFDGYLTKPIDFDDFEAVIRKAIQ